MRFAASVLGAPASLARTPIALTLGAALIAVALGAPCQAQATAPTGGADDKDRCAGLLDMVASLLSAPPTLTASGSDTCTFTNARMDLGSRFGFSIGTLALTGPFAASPAIPPAGSPIQNPVLRRIELRDVVTATDTHNAEMDWLLRQQQVPFDIVLDTTEDTAARTFTVNELSIQGERIGRISVDGVFEAAGPDGLHDSLPAGLPDLSEAGLRAVHLRGDSKRFALTFLMPALIAYWHKGDPEAEMAETRVEAADLAQDLMHAAHTAPGSIDAVLAFIREFPKPQHIIDLSVAAVGDPVTADDAGQAAASNMGLAEVLSRLQVKATYEGDAH